MKKKELRKRLRKLGFRWDDYNLNGVFFYVYTGYDLKHKNGRWEVYYIERTIRNLVGIFEKEEDACDFFYKSYIQVFGNSKYRNSAFQIKFIAFLRVFNIVLAGVVILYFVYSFFNG